MKHVPFFVLLLQSLKYDGDIVLLALRLQDTLTMDIDNSGPVIEPPTGVEELYSHLQTPRYRQLARRSIKPGKKLGSG